MLFWTIPKTDQTTPSQLWWPKHSQYNVAAAQTILTIEDFHLYEKFFGNSFPTFCLVVWEEIYKSYWIPNSALTFGKFWQQT